MTPVITKVTWGPNPRGEGLSTVVKGVPTFPSYLDFPPPSDEPNARMRRDEPKEGDSEVVYCVPGPRNNVYFAFPWGYRVEEKRGSFFIIDTDGDDDLIVEIIPSKNSTVTAYEKDGEIVVNIKPI